jgi:hypothetical protein
MSEARKCDRCHGYFELSAEDQKNRNYPYDMKGTYVKIMLFGRYGEVETSVRWYDLCPNCIESLDKWLNNPDNYDPHDLVKNINEEFQKTSESPKTIKEYCEQREADGDPVTVNELKRKFDIQLPK